MAGIRRLQSGIALLFFLFLIVGIGASLFLSAANASRQRLDQDAKTQIALRQAKDAIIAWSATHQSSPGTLPCPEDPELIGGPNEGRALSSCSNKKILVGRIPWRPLQLDNPTDASGSVLWYVLSPGFRRVAPPGSMGIAPGQLQLDGASNEIAALIIAPGPPLPGQTRTVPSADLPPALDGYLDMDNADGGAFVSAGPRHAFNDQVIAIDTQDLFQAVTPRVLAEIRGAFALNGLRRYHYQYDTFPPNGFDLSDLDFDGDTRKWLAPKSNPNLWFASVSYNNFSPDSASLSLGARTLNVVPCTILPCS